MAVHIDHISFDLVKFVLKHQYVLEYNVFSCTVVAVPMEVLNMPTVQLHLAM